ncbi:unnamed protein product, partial [Mesorhabditis spiculigera]
MKAHSERENTRKMLLYGILAFSTVTVYGAVTSGSPVKNMSSSAAGDGPKYMVEERGSPYTLDYRLYFKGPQGYISPWHDIPLFADEPSKTYNMIVEIPRWSNAKMEISTKEPLSPIKQDEKKGVPRFVHNVFPHKGYIWNYGALPQTWEDPNHIAPETGAKGDNDPIDIIEIGSVVRHRGEVVPVKVVGTLALLDEGETDWKLVAIAVDDPLADKLNNTADVEVHFPGLLKATYDWFKHYKIPAGKPANEFAFDGQYKEADFAHKVINETHDYWKKLMKEPSPALNTQSLQPEAVHQVTQDLWAQQVASQPPLGQPADIPVEVDKWHFIQF